MSELKWNNDARWRWSKTSGPQAAIDLYMSHSGDQRFDNLLDHADRQKLKDGGFEYTAHPYMFDSDPLGDYQAGADALLSMGWQVILTGTETSEYAAENKRSQCWTKRVSITRRPLEQRVLTANRLQTKIDELSAKLKATQNSTTWEEYWPMKTELDYLKQVKKLLLRKN